MYSTIKKIVQTILPKSFLQKNERWLRQLHASVFYRGSKHKCNVCEHQFSKFILLENGDNLCPFCGSISRNRLLWKILSEDLKIQGKVLHFSPSRSLFRKLKNLPHIQYTSTDFEDEFLADKKLDITKINEPDNHFDYIICYHVLEHIVEDKKAMSELFRILKKGGKAIIQTPFKDGDIYEDYSIVSKEDRLNHFGQDDHVRIYSANGLANRLQNFGFQTFVKQFNAIENANYLGFKEKETVIICKS